MTMSHILPGVSLRVDGADVGAESAAPVVECNVPNAALAVAVLAAVAAEPHGLLALDDRVHGEVT